MKQKQKEYQFVLRTMAPVHIGSGETYTAKEYIYEKGKYYFPDMGLLYQSIEQKGYKSKEAFEAFLMRSGNRDNRMKPRLVQFLNDQKITERSFNGYSIKETGLEMGEDSSTYKNKRSNGNLNEIHAFMKDPYGNPYIPGSTLKGAIRTILVNQVFKGNQIPWGAKKGQEFDDVFHQIRVSDSSVIDIKKLILAQKWDFSRKKAVAKPLPIHRECLRPLTPVEFKVTAIGEKAIALIDNLGQLSRKHYKEYKTFFLEDNIPTKYIQNNTQYPIYLGAGSGFWTKTYMEKADPSRHQNARGKMKMEGKGVFKLTKYPQMKFKVSTGEIRQLINNNENFYEMGKCNFFIKELK